MAFPALLLGLLLPTALAWGWGYAAHRQINGHAIDVTPGPLGAYLARHREELVALAVAADERKRDDPAEGPRHYIDFEFYGQLPFDGIPLDRAAAEQRYGAEKLSDWGLLLWRVPEVALALRDALAAGQWDRTISLAADLGHYIGDGHQPLHTTSNYNGQLTGNDGIHYLFESVMLEQHLAEHGPPEGDLEIIVHPDSSVLRWLVESYAGLEPLLAADSMARAGLTEGELAMLARGYPTPADSLSQTYLDRLYRDTGPLAWQRMSLASLRLASVWLWAWKSAGRPRLPD